ncbi:MAG: hypothetical protein BZ136_07785 [Methanosphaera sp. rholeuAM74]|nr:MAG: hypothetical protein BZ136_07785 [Methanosphaera sp. rholeuAM74]
MDYKKMVGLLLVGIIILSIMIAYIGPEQIFDSIKKANIYYVLLAILLQFIIMFLWNYRWSIISTELNIKHNMLQLFAILIVGLAINDLTPSGRSGGEPVRAYLLSKTSNASFKQTFATVMSDKIFDTFPFMILAIFAMIYLIFRVHISQVMLYTLIIALTFFILALLFLIYICFNEELGVKVINWVFTQLDRFTSRDFTKYHSKALSAIMDFQKNLKYLMKNKKLFILASILSFLSWFLELVRVYVVFLAFGTNVSLGMIAAVFLVSTLVGIIPALPGGLGSIDGLMILLYSVSGISASISTAATIIERAISLWMVLILGIIILPYFGTGVLDKVEMT